MNEKYLTAKQFGERLNLREHYVREHYKEWVDAFGIIVVRVTADGKNNPKGMLRFLESDIEKLMLAWKIN